MDDTHTPPTPRTTNSSQWLESFSSGSDTAATVRLATKQVSQLHTRLLTKLRGFLVTQEAKEQVKELVPTTDTTTIFARQRTCEEAKLFFTSLTEERETIQQQITQALGFDPHQRKRHTNIVIAFGDEDAYNKYKSELTQYFYVCLITHPTDIEDLTHYEQIRFVAGEKTGLTTQAEQLEQATILRSGATLVDIAPELYTDPLQAQPQALAAFIHLSAYLQMPSTIPTFSSIKEKDKIDLHQIHTQAQALQESIHQALNSAQVTGSALLAILQGKGSILEQLPSDLKEKIIKQKTDIIKTYEDALGLSCPQLLAIHHDGTVTVSVEELNRLQRQQRQLCLAKEQEAKQDKAGLAKQFLDHLHDLKTACVALDMKLGLGAFITTYDLHRPHLHKEGIRFVYGKNMFIDDAVPVEYYIGQQERTAVLTGANSGGKTTLIELLLQIQLLTQMGLYVPAQDAQVELKEEIYYFSKNKGSLNAGAFETLLKTFASITQQDCAKLILADEIESVTEPDIALEIIHHLITQLNTQPQVTTILVTHMGRELKDKSIPARFDGIEAKGLDEDLQLIVERNPIIGRIARSTPQLIIERLAKKEGKPYYTSLLQSIRT